MRHNFTQSLVAVLKHEGGYVDHPRDPGGATNKGITIAVFRRHVKRNGTKADLKKLTTEQAGKVYRAQYWDKIKGDDLPGGVDFAVFDFAVNSGPSRAAKYLQKLLLVKVDGKIGPNTIAAACRANANQLVDLLCNDRLSFMKRATSKGKRLWPTFGTGWGRRVLDVRIMAKLMARRESPAPTPVKPAPITPKPPTKRPSGIVSVFWAIFAFITKGKRS